MIRSPRGPRVSKEEITALPRTRPNRHIRSAAPPPAPLRGTIAHTAAAAVSATVHHAAAASAAHAMGNEV